MKDEKTRYEVILAGSGGQGLVLSSIMLGEAALLEGRVVAQTQSYGVASRGGFSMAEVIIDTREIIFQQVQHPDIVLALTEESMGKFAPYAGQGVPVFFDTALVKARKGKNLAGFPFTQLAGELGNVASVNVLALGAIIARIPVVRMESIEQVIRKRFRGALQEMNLRALQEGERLAGRP